MKKFVLLFFFIPLTLLFPQDKYFIYFTDKGPQASLQKTGQAYREALQQITPRALERRKKAMNADSLITYEDLPVFKDYINQLLSLGIRIENKLDWFNSVSTFMDDEMKEQAANLSFVSKIEPVRTIKFDDYKVDRNVLPKINNATDPEYGNSYVQLALSDVPTVHSKGITGNGIIIGILDTGFDWKEHEALKNAHVLDEYDFVFHDSVTANQVGDDPNQDSHGTYVFSVIAGYKDSILIGPAYGASYILAKTEDIRSETHIEEDNYAAALEWMENLGVDITSSSLGYNQFDPSTYSYTYEDMNGNTTIVTKAAEMAFERGVVTITAAGNEGNKKWYYIIAPADGYKTMAVGAVNSNNTLASFSSRGPTFDGRTKPDIVAMGVDVYGASTGGTNGYTYGSGTSAATPIAGGIAGLLLSLYPHLTNDQLRNIFHETSDNSESPDNERGYGLLSAAKAVSFPNLQAINGGFLLHKSFLDTFSVHEVRLHYSSDKINFDALNMNFITDYKFDYQLPSFYPNQEVDFYFTYKDEAGNSYRDPFNKNYKIRYGDLTVSLNVALVPTGYILSHNYPNPFNSSTSIDFIADGNMPAELAVYDVIGRKVKTLFKGISRTGVNHYVWNGVTDGGFEAASGIYVYTLNLNGDFYTRKMVYLK